jgi:hypothetical protein
MVTTIHNVTRDMQTIGCYVDNGFGTPMQSSRQIEIERAPRIRTPESKSIVQPVGTDIRLECEVDAWPAPNMKIGAYQSQFSQSDRFEVKSITVGTRVFKTQLLIRNAQVEDSGNFYCTANNTHGFAKEEGIKLIIQQPTEHVIIIIIATWIRDVQDKCFNVFSESRFDAMLQRSRCTAKLSWNLYSKS